QELFGDLPVIVPGNDVLDCPVRHRLKLMETDVLSPESLHAIREASRDKSVLIVVNQINRAIAVFRELQPHVTDIHLLHSRFTASDRTRKEREIEPRPGRILVATQVVEVSLDLDYDCCFSELAPLEALLQRFGRCNRRGRQSE